MKTVLLTGASSGLGRVLALELLNRGYFVILHYFQDKAVLESIHLKYPNQSIIIQCDLRNEEDVKKMKEDLKHLNIFVDILINNAAIDHVSDIEEKNTETFLEVFKVNTLGAFFMIKYFGQEINECHGAILNVSSDNAIDMYDVVTMEYDISKSGLNIMTKSFAKYYTEAFVNAICFGWLDTPMNNFPEDIKKQINFVPLDKASHAIIKMIESKNTGSIEIVR